MMMYIDYFFVEAIQKPCSCRPSLRGDARKEAIDIYDHITSEELKENYMKYIPKLGIKI
jgi:integrase/recombinase XerD